jgi:hypothetical protein
MEMLVVLVMEMLVVRIRVLFVFDGSLSSNTWAYWPSSNFRSAKLVLGLPVSMVKGVIVLEALSFAGNWLRDRFAASTMALVSMRGNFWKGTPCTVDRILSLMVLMDISTCGTWSSASAMLRVVGSMSSAMLENSWSASILLIWRPRAWYRSSTALILVCKELALRFGMLETVRIDVFRYGVYVRASFYEENVDEQSWALVLGNNRGGDSYRLEIGRSLVLFFGSLSF